VVAPFVVAHPLAQAPRELDNAEEAHHAREHEEFADYVPAGQEYEYVHYGKVSNTSATH
jgi:hypothetical protein